jgi:hypothetical protein
MRYFFASFGFVSQKTTLPLRPWVVFSSASRESPGNRQFVWQIKWNHANTKNEVRFAKRHHRARIGFAPQNRPCHAAKLIL